MQNRLLIGIGNPLREDDGVGWAAAERLAALNLAHVRVETAHQLLPEMAEWLAQADGAVVIDAAVGGEPGAVTVRQIRPNPDTTLLNPHHITPQTLAAQALALYGRCARLTLVTVSAERLGFGSTLSPTVAAALPLVVARVSAELDAIRPREKPN